jgi:ribonuclease III
MTNKRKSEEDAYRSAKRSRFQESTQEPTMALDSPSHLPSLPPISPEISEIVFTHQSKTSTKASRNQSASYERLEFVGDAYIEMMATRLVWDRFKDLPAGRLSQLREMLVKNETLGNIAVMYGLDKRVAVSAEVMANPKVWKKVKGDVIEAYVAAIVLADETMGGAGYTTAERWLHELWTPKLKDMLEEKVPDLNTKDELSRKIVSQGVRLEYREERPMKLVKNGQQILFIGAFLSGWGYDRELLGRGQGLNKTVAGNLAAANALANPLVEKIAEMKREFDEMRTGGRVDKNIESSNAESQAREERVTRERELVQKKRDMFMSSEFG